jgi:hypothetical protein
MEENLGIWPISPFADQQRELDALVNRSKIEVTQPHRSLTFFASDVDKAGLSRAEKFLTQAETAVHEPE